MPSRFHDLEKSTQTDLLYGLALGGGSGVAMLEPLVAAEEETSAPEDAAGTEKEASSVDAILQNAATRADSSLTGQVEHIDSGAASPARKPRWRFQDGIAPLTRSLAPQFPQYAVEDRPRPLTLVALARRTRGFSLGMLTSFALHVVLIPALVLFNTSDRSSRLLPVLEATHLEVEPALEIIEAPAVVGLPSNLDELQAQPITLEFSVPETSVDRGAAPGLYSTHVAVALLNRTQGPVQDIHELFGKAGSGKSQTGLGKGGAEFFGAKATGSRFVFVVDCSLSMAENGRWLQACEELDAAVARLKEDQLFYVVLFDGRMHRMFNHDEGEAQLYPATEANKQRFRKWLSTAQLGYETLPWTSVLCAFQLQPDAIYLLSDGEFHDKTAAGIKNLNRPLANPERPHRRVVVHTINLHNRTLAASATLRKIAAENDGQYLFVPAK